MFILSHAEVEKRSGELYLRPPKIFSTQEEAYAEMRKEYFEYLESKELEDNDQYDDNDEGFPGGLILSDMASIREECEYALGQLLETQLFTIHKF